MRPIHTLIVLVHALALAACSASNTDSPSDAGSSPPPSKDAAVAGDAGHDAGAAPPEDASITDSATAPDAQPAAWSCPPGPFGAPVPSGAKAEVVQGVPANDGFINGPGVLEGPVWFEGALYLTHFENHSVPTSRILRWSESDGLSIANPDSGANGLAIDANGALVAARHADGSISRFSDMTHLSPIATTFDGKRFDSPNDLAIRADGNIYFSDPDWQSPETHPQAKTRVYRVAPGGEVAVIDDTLDEPNGVTLAPSGTRLYVSGLGGVFAYDVAADGSTSTKKAFASSLKGSDGMGIDCAGNVYVAYQSNVVVVAPAGTEITRIAVSGVGAVTNVAFGGADRKTLFITSLGDNEQHLHRITLAVPGLPY